MIKRTLGAFGLASVGTLTVLSILLWCFLAASWFLGVYLAFSASFILGLIVLVAQPSPIIIGLAYMGFGVDLAAKALQAFTS